MNCRAGRCAEDELRQEQAEQRERLLHRDRPVGEDRDRERRLRGGEEQLLTLQRRKDGRCRCRLEVCGGDIRRISSPCALA